MDCIEEDARLLADRLTKFAQKVPPSAVLHPLMALATESPEQLLADYSEQDGTATWRILALLGGNIIYVGGSALAPMGWTWEAQHNRSPVDDETVSAWSRPRSTVKCVQIRESRSQGTCSDGPTLEQASFAWSVTFDDMTLDWPLNTRGGDVDALFVSILRPTG